MLELNPGPSNYEPKDKPEIEKAPKYTFGFRRFSGTQNHLVCNSATPIMVGPGRYVPEAGMSHNNRLDFPRWSLPKEGRMPPPAR